MRSPSASPASPRARSNRPPPISPPPPPSSPPPRSPLSPRPRSPRRPSVPPPPAMTTTPTATPTLASFPSFSSSTSTSASWELPRTTGLGITFGGSANGGGPSGSSSLGNIDASAPSRKPSLTRPSPHHRHLPSFTRSSRPRMRHIVQYTVFVLVAGSLLALLIVVPTSSSDDGRVQGLSIRPGASGRGGRNKAHPEMSDVGPDGRWDPMHPVADDGYEQDITPSPSSSSSSSWTTLSGIRFYSPTYLLRAASSIRQRLRSTSSRNLYRDVSSLPKSWTAGKDYRRPLHLVLGPDGRPLRDKYGEALREEDQQQFEEGDSWKSWRGAWGWLSGRLPGNRGDGHASSLRNDASFINEHDARYGQTSWSSLSPSIREFREWEYARALQHQGTGDRIMRFLEKARSGRGFTVSVVGGSVSKGRGLPPWQGGEDPEMLSAAANERQQAPNRHLREPAMSLGKRERADHFHIDPSPEISRNLYNPLNLHRQVFSFLNATFPADEPHASPNLFVNGAQGGVGSDYFAGCWKEHIPEDSDLVIVELGINDERELSAMEDFEHLLRSLIEMPSHPAIIVVQTFTLLFPTLSQASSLHTDVAAYYDVPVLALRDVLLPRLLNDPSVIPDKGGPASSSVGDEVRKWFRNVPPHKVMPGDAKVVDGVDLMHISHHGHTLLADLLIHYLELQMTNLQPYDAYLSAASDSDAETDPDAQVFQGTDVPAMLLASPYDPSRRMRRDDPFCQSTNSLFPERRLHAPGHPQETKPSQPISSSSIGWEEWNWGEKRYIRSANPGAKITFPVEIRAKPSHHVGGGTDGYVRIGYQRSMTLGLGSVECWVDEHVGDDRRHGSTGTAEVRSHTSSATVAGVALDSEHAPTLTAHSLQQRQQLTRKRLDGYWKIKERNKAVMATIRDDLPPGHHLVTCELLDDTADPGGGKEFRLVAVVHN